MSGKMFKKKCAKCQGTGFSVYIRRDPYRPEPVDKVKCRVCNGNGFTWERSNK